MANELLIENRVADLEREVSELKRRLAILGRGKENWIDQVSGSQAADQEAFQEVLELGRAARQADRPTE
jgi:hypothetical protein